jgi:negative regulator of flagellin synthesis FlgM
MKLTDVVAQIQTENKIKVKKSNQAEETAAGNVAANDSVSLSSGSRDVQKIKEILLETPDIRTEKVAELKARIESGEYQVDSRQLADKMLADLLDEESLLNL